MYYFEIGKCCNSPGDRIWFNCYSSTTWTASWLLYKLIKVVRPTSVWANSCRALDCRCRVSTLPGADWAVITCKSVCSAPRGPPGTVDAVAVGLDPLEMTLEANELPKMTRNIKQEQWLSTINIGRLNRNKDISALTIVFKEKRPQVVHGSSLKERKYTFFFCHRYD